AHLALQGGGPLPENHRRRFDERRRDRSASRPRFGTWAWAQIVRGLQGPRADPWRRAPRRSTRDPMRIVLRTSAVVLLLLLSCAAAERRHDATSHHSFADVAHWSAMFDDPSRDAWQKPAEVVAALGLRPGMTVADLGAGTGYFSRHLSAAGGPEGAVLAADTEPNMVAHLRERAEAERTPNVVPILASADNPRLPAHATDLVLVVDTFHHIDDRLTYLRGLRRCLKPGGRVAVI